MAMSVQSGGSAAICVDPRTGAPQLLGNGKFELVIDADVVDSAGNHIGSLTSIAERAIDGWQKLLISTGISI